MKRLLAYLFLVFFFITPSFSADEFTKRLDKLTKQLDATKEMYDDGVLSEEDYEKTKNILLDKVDTTKKAVKEKKVTEEKELNEILSNQLNVIAKLYDDGMLSEEEYKATKNILLDKAETVIKEQLDKGALIRPKISIE